MLSPSNVQRASATVGTSAPSQPRSTSARSVRIRFVRTTPQHRSPHPSIFASPSPAPFALDIHSTLLHLTHPPHQPSSPPQYRTASPPLLHPDLQKPSPQRAANSPYQHLPQTARALQVDELLRPAQLDVHVRVHADQAALVLRLAPLQAHDDFFVDSVCGGKVSGWEEELVLGVRGQVSGRVKERCEKIVGECCAWILGELRGMASGADSGSLGGRSCRATYRSCSMGRGFLGMNCGAGVSLWILKVGIRGIGLFTLIVRGGEEVVVLGQLACGRARVEMGISRLMSGDRWAGLR